MRTAAGISQWTPEDIKAMYPWLPPDQYHKLVASLCFPVNYDEKPPPMVKIYPRRPPRIVPAWEHDRSPEGEAYRWARKEHAFLRRCERATLREVGEELGVTKETVRHGVYQFSRRLSRAMRHTKFYFMEDGK
jgi:hypothetical protein